MKILVNSSIIQAQRKNNYVSTIPKRGRGWNQYATHKVIRVVNMGTGGHDALH